MKLTELLESYDVYDGDALTIADNDGGYITRYDVHNGVCCELLEIDVNTISGGTVYLDTYDLPTVEESITDRRADDIIDIGSARDDDDSGYHGTVDGIPSDLLSRSVVDESGAYFSDVTFITIL